MNIRHPAENLTFNRTNYYYSIFLSEDNTTKVFRSVSVYPDFISFSENVKGLNVEKTISRMADFTEEILDYSNSLKQIQLYKILKIGFIQNNIKIFINTI